MKLAQSSDIRKIDSFAEQTLEIPKVTLMGRSGHAVAKAVRECLTDSGYVIIFAGKGNNGGDGYALAAELAESFRVRVYDVFSAGQKTDEGQHYLDLYTEHGGEVLPMELGDALHADIESADVVVDAVFGTGFCGALPESVRKLSAMINSARKPKKVAIDVSIGVNADDGSVSQDALSADVTVALSYMKAGLLSYPARAFTGRLILDNIGLPNDIIEQNFDFSSFYFDDKMAQDSLLERTDNSNKGSFGKALLITGAEEYIGAGLLTIEAALRGGCGYVTHVCKKDQRDIYCHSFPEVIYRSDLCNGRYSVNDITALSEKSSATLIGCGCGISEDLADLTEQLIMTPAPSPLVVDADAINSLAFYKGREVLRKAKRTLILTPHPRELSRISLIPTEHINENRISVAKNFAKEYGVILVLKGAATIVTNGDSLYINSTGSSALAKAGSGDVLAGLLISVLSYHTDPLIATALSVYLHGAAGDELAKTRSSYGVTPSDLPLAIAKVVSELESENKKKK